MSCNSTSLCVSEVHRLNTIAPYFTMFPLDFPYNLLADARKGTWVLDPFCGRGTTTFAARLRGLPSVGIDSNPVATAIASAKLVSVTPEEIIELCNRTLSSDRQPKHVPEGAFWTRCFTRRTLSNLCLLREELLKKYRSPARTALRAILLGLLHGPRYQSLPGYLSNQMPRTYATKPDAAVRYWRRHNLHPREIDILDLVSRRAGYTFGKLPAASKGDIYLADSREISIPRPRGGFQWVITSPPYWGMRTYWPDQWLRYWFLGGPAEVSYTQENQVGHGSLPAFAENLSRVWSNCAGVCARGARLIIRFGALPSKAVDPATLLRESLKRADSGWVVTRVDDAGTSLRGNRQAQQFSRRPGAPALEVDLHAILE